MNNKIIKILKESDIEKLDRYNKKGLANTLLSILEFEISDFSYYKDIDYLNTLFNVLPEYLTVNDSKSKSYDKLKLIHQKMKTYLVQKPGFIEKTNHNYKLLKSLIYKVEFIQMSILYDYCDKYKGSIYELFDYIIFDFKNISVFNDALNRFPYLVNYFDKNDKNLIVSVCEAYIDEVMKYNLENGIDNIIYFDEIIDKILDSEVFMFDIIDKQTILKKINDCYRNINSEKERKIFYLNSLIEKLKGEKIQKDVSYLEYKFNINYNFNEAVKSEVRRLVSNYSISKDRKEIDDYILTFDGEDAKEIDDALSVKILDNDNILLGVHIADPTDIIDFDSIIYEEASKRTTSIYLSDRTYSMFPEVISTDLMSLKEGNYRPAITYYFEFDKNGNLINYDFIKSIINVNRNMTYDDFNKILGTSDKSNLANTINNLNIVSQILQRYYHKDPLYERVNRVENNITNTNIIGHTSGEKVIESTMIFTNYMVAKFFYDNNLPFDFRNHYFDKETIAMLDKLKNNIIKEISANEYSKYIDMVKSMYPKALYEVVNKGHFGLGVPCYGHVTSPLRRNADPVGIRCLNEFYFNEYDDKKVEEIRSFVLKQTNNINKTRSSKEKFSKEYELLKQ